LRYVLRPPIAQERVVHLPDGLVRITLKKAYADTGDCPWAELLDQVRDLAPRIYGPPGPWLNFGGLYGCITEGSMKTVPRAATGVATSLGLFVGFRAFAATPAPPARPVPTALPSADRNGSVLTSRAAGAFDVTLAPLPADEKPEGAAVGRMAIDKRFHGDLEGTSRGQMLATTTAVKGSAGYVAIEIVSGKLQGRSGTFALQHHGMMDRGEPDLTITVIPDSGTGELAGLAGTMKIVIAEGKHSYELDYTLPAAK
jgi:hypothetical protein